MSIRMIGPIPYDMMHTPMSQPTSDDVIPQEAFPHFLKNPFRKKPLLPSLLAGLFMIAGLIFGVFSLSQKQDIRKKAAASPYALTKECRTTSTSAYSSCWTDESRSPCALVVDMETNDVDKENAYCNTGVLCKFKGTPLSCKKSLNPIQSAVDISSGKNQAMQPKKIRYEVFLEPGEFTVEQTCTESDLGCSGFARSINGTPVANGFESDRFAVQVPSYTQITGTLKDNAHVSVFFIPERVYDVWGGFKDTIAGAKGQGVTALFSLTNVYGAVDTTKEAEVKSKLYDPSVTPPPGPVRDVVIQNIRMLGVGGPGRLVQNESDEKAKNQWKHPGYYCTESPCFYRYTAMMAINAKRVSGGNVKIRNNRMEMFGEKFMMLGHLFNLSSAVASDLLHEGFVTQLRVDGTPDSPVLIANNTMDGAIGADALIVWGSYIDITGNTIKNGFSDWYGNQIAVSIYMDSHHIRAVGNTLDHWLTGFNLEGPIALAPGKDYTWLKNSDRVAHDNTVENNTLTNTLVCIVPQRQVRAAITGNTCSNDKAKWEHLLDPSLYAPPKNDFLQSLFGGTPPTQKEAHDMFCGIPGFGMHIRTSQDSFISGNTFNDYPKGFLMEPVDHLKAGMKNMTFSKNTFSISKTSLDSSHAYAGEVNCPVDYFYDIYWYPSATAETPADIRFCSSNKLIYGWGTARLTNKPNQPGQILNAVCQADPTAVPVSTAMPTPTPAGCPSGQTKPYYIKRAGQQCVSVDSCGVSTCMPSSAGCPVGQTKPFYQQYGFSCVPVRNRCGTSTCKPE
ncbi:MAG: hypothetical protein UW52_C0046G0002 [Candidatus Gottesmanbacteria bacterium GW2011_GWA1_44_24b]|uniref:Uncharacterized protein n=1 Tax=Candidatus Gottesmanbacteria bacterium GW2011_GWA1_44_24b TaxID=1618437 RepID=A0A0G1IIJ2_9BACT|nr:MAG: hypothetical protein UW52_C0046G0002 [Candidatus Gottesmanbacteria bacterium GW2011_GWA1_44_24b]